MSDHHEEEVLGKAYDARLMRRLLTYLWPYKWYALTSLVLTILSAPLVLAGPPVERRDEEPRLIAIPESDRRRPLRAAGLGVSLT